MRDETRVQILVEALSYTNVTRANFTRTTDRLSLAVSTVDSIHRKKPRNGTIDFRAFDAIDRLHILGLNVGNATDVRECYDVVSFREALDRLLAIYL